MTIAPTIRPIRFILVVAAVLVLFAWHLERTRPGVRRCCVRPRTVVATAPLRQRYLAAVPRDSWNRKLRLQCPSRHGRRGCDISSAGSDGVFGTDDDINSWDL